MMTNNMRSEWVGYLEALAFRVLEAHLLAGDADCAKFLFRHKARLARPPKPRSRRRKKSRGEPRARPYRDGNLGSALGRLAPLQPDPAQEPVGAQVVLALPAILGGEAPRADHPRVGAGLVQRAQEVPAAAHHGELQAVGAGGQAAGHVQLVRRPGDHPGAPAVEDRKSVV